MVAVAAGPPLAVDGPLPVAPPHGLLSVAQIVDTTDPHWGLGVNVYGYPADTPFVWDPCSTGTFRPKEEGEPSPTAMFGPFVAYLPIKCTARGIDPATFSDRARLAFQAKESFAVETALARAPQNVLNPHLADTNADVLVVGAQAAQTGLSYLEDAIGATAGGGVIHATPAIATAWAYGGGLAERSGRLYTVAAGTPVAVGGGYIGAIPEDVGGALAAGTAWAFATGPVQVRRGEIEMVPRTLAEALDRELNDVVYKAERTYVVDWDTALQAAVLIDWSP